MRDANHVNTVAGKSSADETTLPWLINPVTGKVLMYMTSESLSVTVGSVNKRDANHVPTMYGVSSVDGTTPVPLHVSPTGRILITS